MGSAERCLFAFLASVSLMACGSDAPAASAPDSMAEVAASTEAEDHPISSTPFEPARLQFGPIADFAQGVNELNVPRRVFLIVDGDNVSALNRKDPNNGCTLFAVDDQARADNGISAPAARFFDPCHGYVYDISGQPLCAGSSALRPIEIDVVDGVVTWAGMDLDSSEPTEPNGDDCPDMVEH